MRLDDAQVVDRKGNILLPEVSVQTTSKKGLAIVLGVERKRAW